MELLRGFGEFAYPNAIGPGVYNYSLNGKPLRFVNNMDGSLGNTYPDVPAGNTGIYQCG